MRPHPSGIGATTGFTTRWLALHAWTKTYGTYHVEWRVLWMSGRLHIP